MQGVRSRRRSRKALPDAAGQESVAAAKYVVKLESLPWRTGRKVGRTIYAQLGAEPDDHDPLIGMLDTAVLARAAVRAHNKELR
jgi:hypothetical protein